MDEGLVVDREFLQGLLRASEGDPGLTVSRVEVSPACKSGDNYMSTVSRVQVCGPAREGARERRWSLIVKQEPSNPATRQMLGTNSVFNNEAALYSRVLHSFKRCFGDAVDTLRMPRCLYASSPSLNSSDSIIVLEDLQPAGFCMPDRHAGLDYEHCRLALQELARYHSFSLAMKRLDPEAFHKTRNLVKEVVYKPDTVHTFGPSLENSCRMAIGGLRLLASDDAPLQDAIRALERRRGGIFQRMSELVAPSEPFSVIGHGDFWINNILFSYRRRSEGSSEMVVDDVRLLDLQVARYCSPAIDILHFLYTSTFGETRRRHWDDLLHAYHESLNDTFRRLVKGTAHEASEAISFRQLLQEVEERQLYGLFNGMLIMTAVTADVDNIPDMDTITVEDFYSEKALDHWISSQTPSYRQRTRELVMEYYEKGLI